MVKGVSFEGLAQRRGSGGARPALHAEGIDELVLLDVTATIEDDVPWRELSRTSLASCSCPLTVGGGITSDADAGAVIEAGADKVSINSAALADSR